MGDENSKNKKQFTLYLDEDIIKLLTDEKWDTRKSPSFIVNEILKKRYKLNKKGGVNNV